MKDYSNFENPALIADMKESLKKNIPIPVMIGVGDDPLKLFLSVKGANLAKLGEAIKINAHWITVTGYLEDEIDKRTKLIVSSWGGKYYVYLDEYIENAGLLGSVNIITNLK